MDPKIKLLLEIVKRQADKARDNAQIYRKLADDGKPLYESDYWFWRGTENTYRNIFDYALSLFGEE